MRIFMATVLPCLLLLLTSTSDAARIKTSKKLFRVAETCEQIPQHDPAVPGFKDVNEYFQDVKVMMIAFAKSTKPLAEGKVGLMVGNIMLRLNKVFGVRERFYYITQDPPLGTLRSDDMAKVRSIGRRTGLLSTLLEGPAWTAAERRAGKPLREQPRITLTPETATLSCSFAEVRDGQQVVDEVGSPVVRSGHIRTNKASDIDPRLDDETFTQEAFGHEYMCKSRFISHAQLEMWLSNIYIAPLQAAG